MGNIPMIEKIDSLSLHIRKTGGLILITLMISACGRGELDEQFVQSARHGELDRVSALLAQGANIEARDSKHGATALMWAAHEGHLVVLRFLLENGAEINARQKLGRTALWYTAQQGQLEAARVLVGHAAAVTSIADDGTTAAMVARRRGFPEIAEMLSNIGAAE